MLKGNNIKYLKTVLIALLISSPFIVYFVGERNYESREKQLSISLLEMEIEGGEKIIEELKKGRLQQIEELRSKETDEEKIKLSEHYLNKLYESFIQSRQESILKAKEKLDNLKHYAE